MKSSIRTVADSLSDTSGLTSRQSNERERPSSCPHESRVPLSHCASLTPNAPTHSSPACSTISPSALLKQSVEPCRRIHTKRAVVILPCQQRRGEHGADGLGAHRHGLNDDDARGSLAGVDLDEAVGCVLPQHRSVARPAVNDP